MKKAFVVCCVVLAVTDAVYSSVSIIPWPRKVLELGGWTSATNVSYVTDVARKRKIKK